MQACAVSPRLQKGGSPFIFQRVKNNRHSFAVWFGSPANEDANRIVSPVAQFGYSTIARAAKAVLTVFFVARAILFCL